MWLSRSLVRTGATVALLASLMSGASSALAEPEAIPPYPSATKWSCLEANPSCARDPWWLEHDEVQDDTLVTYQAIGPHFSTERRYVEAVNLLWQWPAGADLLRQAEADGILVMTLTIDDEAFASYSKERHLIVVDKPVVTAPTWLLADVLAHELEHNADASAGRFEDRTSANCFAREAAAFQAERAFLVWLTRTLEPEGLPSIAAVANRLAQEHVALAEAAFERGFSTDLATLARRDYVDNC